MNPDDGATAAALSGLPTGYEDFLISVKARIQGAQTRAMLAVNHELVLLYWEIGRDILVRQEKEGWGAKVLDRLAADLHSAFPDVRGLSSRNLRYMRIRRSLAGRLNCAASCCTIAVVSPLCAYRQGERRWGT